MDILSIVMFKSVLAHDLEKKQFVIGLGLYDNTIDKDTSTGYTAWDDSVNNDGPF